MKCPILCDSTLHWYKHDKVSEDDLLIDLALYPVNKYTDLTHFCEKFVVHLNMNGVEVNQTQDNGKRSTSSLSFQT